MDGLLTAPPHEHPSKLQACASMTLGFLALVSLFIGTAVVSRPSLIGLHQAVSFFGLAVAVIWLGVGLAGMLAVRMLPAKLWLLSVLVVALVCRVVAFLSLADATYSPGSDPVTYIQIAQSLGAGHGLSAHLPQMAAGLTYKAFYPPVYPVLVALVGQVVGINSSAVWLINCAIDLSIAWSLVSIGRAIDDRIIGLVAAWIYLIWPSAIFSVTVPQKDTLAVLLALQISLSFLKLLHRGSRVEQARLGISSALLILTQPAFAPFPFCVAAAFSPKAGLRRVSIVLLRSAPITTLLLLPWWIRNWLVLRSFVPLTSSSGFSMLVAATGHYTSLNLYFSSPELQGSRQAARAALQLFTTHPIEVIYRRADDIGKAALLENFALLRMRPTWATYEFYSTFVAAVQLFLDFVLVAAGWGIFIWRKYEPVLLLLFGCLLQFIISGLCFEFGERHRYIAMPFIFLFAAAAIHYYPLRDLRVYEVRLNSKDGVAR